MILGSPAAPRHQSHVRSKAAPRALFFLLFGGIFEAPALAISSPPQELLRQASISYQAQAEMCSGVNAAAGGGGVSGGVAFVTLRKSFSCASCFLTLM